MAQLYPKLILEALSKVKYPGDGLDIVMKGMVEDDVRINGQKVTFTLAFQKKNDPFRKSLAKACESAIHTYIDKGIEVNIEMKFPEPPPKPLNEALPNVKNVIAVASGKGGVGKSTVASNLAIALALQGYKVGLLDADIYGPSVPTMFALEDAKPLMDKIGEKDVMIPMEKYGIKTLSIGFFVEKDNAIVWRGSMATGAVKQLITDVHWGELDYFVIDMPPGTSDIHLTLVQTLAITGAVIVSTPQSVALADAKRGINMFQNEKINVPVLGLVENMAWFTPAELPENRYYIFGEGGCKTLAEQMEVPLLGQIPIVQSIREGGDKGAPVALDPDSVTGNAFAELATAVIERVNYRNENMDPTQVVEMQK